MFICATEINTKTIICLTDLIFIFGFWHSLKQTERKWTALTDNYKALRIFYGILQARLILLVDKSNKNDR